MPSPFPYRVPPVIAIAALGLACRMEGSGAPVSEMNTPGAVPALQPATPAPPQNTPAPNAAEPAPGAAAPANPEQPVQPTERAPAPAAPASSEGGGAAMAPPAGSAPTDAPPNTAPTTPPALTPPAPAGPVTLYLAGDSTVMTYADTPTQGEIAGWGQMLAPHVVRDITVDNRAIGGRTARRFIDEGRLDEIFAELLPGDYLLVQFGTNDGNRTATYTLGDETIPYFLEPATDFKSYLQQYIDGARERSAIPVLVTPPPRNSAYCTGGNGTGAHAQAMRELGQAQAVPVADLNAASVAHLRAICPAPTPEDFFLVRADGSIDGTHFQENGARILAGLVVSSLREAVPALAPLLE